MQSNVMFYTIKTIEPNADNYSIKLIYSDNVDLRRDAIIKKSGRF